MAQSLRSLQRFAGLNETGLLDAATIRLMAQPRCGMPDLSPADKARRRRRYVLQGTLWKKKVGIQTNPTMYAGFYLFLLKRFI